MTDPIEGEIVDERTGEIVPAGVSNLPAVQIKEKRDNAIDFEAVDLKDVGTLEVSEAANTVLTEPLKEEDIRIRPDGNIYVPWTYYAGRLNRAFGVAGWGLIPQGNPRVMPLSKQPDSAVLVVWGHWLVVKGVPIGFAMGEMTYYPSNTMTSYADACEGAKSNSLARACKLLGMTLELWDSEFGAKWKAKYAEQYTNDRNKKVWRKKLSGSAPQPVAAQPKATIHPAEPVKKASTKAESPKTNDAPPSVATVKAEWIQAAISHHIMSKVDDKTGADNLKVLLGKLYTDLADFNAAVSLPQGMKLIESAHKAP